MTTQQYWWRSLEEYADDPAFLEKLGREFPFAEYATSGVDRRRFLHLMAASLALAGLSACDSKEPENMQPRVDQVPGETAGVPRYVTTAVLEEGYATGVILQHRMGRPVKLEGNPDHPASLGASDAIMQARLLDLYDPERSAAVLNKGEIRAWASLDLQLAAKREQWSQGGGKGLRILTGRLTSPTLFAQLSVLLTQYPEARWHRWEPLSRANLHAGAMTAFGRAVESIPIFDRADVVLAIESDAISGAPGHLAFARAFADRRRAAESGQGPMSRVYAIESTPTLIGAAADHRFALKPVEIELILRALAAKLNAGPAAWATADTPAWLDTVARDLGAHRGRALLHAGPEQSANVHALVHAINESLGAQGRTIRYLDPVAVDAETGASLGDLATEMHRGEVDTLLMLETNPVYDAPADLGFADALSNVALSIELATHVDETAKLATFHAPALHMFETWSDGRAFDGTASILQPQIRSLIQGRSAAEMIASLSGAVARPARNLVRDHWRSQVAGDFDQAWSRWLRKGMIDGSAASETKVQLRNDFAGALAKPSETRHDISVLLRPDPFLRAGAMANSSWLQELPRPLTRLVWDNAAVIAPATAARLDIRDEDVIEMGTGGGAVRLPALLLPGQAEDCVTLSLGYGRKAVGKVGTGVGADIYAVRRSSELWLAAASLRKTGQRHTLALTQHHHDMAGRDIVRTKPVDQFLSEIAEPRPSTPQPSLYPAYRYDGNKWGMAINLSACIGCGACVAACQAENNIPIVGREEVLRGREMHWLRVDRYWGGAPENPETLFQPVPCMHCEEAPCEVVCPVNATNHDHDGLNVMVYNRCVGTRFCSNNCPYKVRRFNFYGYAQAERRPAISWNPDVTVRGRGVMEKCNYCLQRIREAKITADRENRAIADGEVKTACQQACPTSAIAFGDLNDRESEVNRRKASSLDYALLEELNTRPRTTYAARLVNRNPEIAES